MKKDNYSNGLEAALSLMGGKWKFLIIWRLMTGKQRFGELRRLVGGVSEKVLIQDLKELAEDGIVRRIDHKEVPPRVEYELTELGETLAEACHPLCEWGKKNMSHILDLEEPTRSNCGLKRKRAAAATES
jgi:DNA-binding HxlR family transcriptional regulator